MERLIGQMPVQRYLLIPLMPLGEILAHEEKLLARMSQHEGVSCLQVGELVLIDARHLVDHRTLQVNHLIVGEHQNVVFAGHIGDAEGHLIVVELAEIGI